MGLVLFRNLSASEAEQVVSGIWLAAERYGWSDPILTFQFDRANGFVSISVTIEHDSDKVVEYNRLLAGRTQAGSGKIVIFAPSGLGTTAAVEGQRCRGESGPASLRKGSKLRRVSADGLGNGLI